MIFSRLFNQTAQLYNKSIGISNDYGEKNIGYVYSIDIICSLQSKLLPEEILALGQETKPGITNIIYTPVNATIKEGDRLQIDSIKYEILAIGKYNRARIAYYKLEVRKI